MAGTVSCSEITADWQPFDGSQPYKSALHIWHAPIADLLSYKEQLQAVLTAQEKQAAAKYRQQKHEDRYIIQHGLLRLLIGWYLGERAYASPFVFNANKKPFLTDNCCYFNISHTEGHLLLAVGNVELGVDIEHINPDFDYRDITSHYFSEAETQFIAQASNPRQAFFLLWTRKEALLKSSGLGIDDNLPLIPALNGNCKLPVHFNATSWQTQTFMMGDRYIGSVTHPVGERRLKFWKLEELEFTGFNES